jgi:hypothetical protein
MSDFDNQNTKEADNNKNYLDLVMQSSDRLDPTQRYSGLRIDSKYNPMIPNITLDSLNSLTGKYYDASAANINKNVWQEGQLAAGRGYSMGLSNPFAYSQHAENQARGAMGTLEAQRAGQMMQNPLTMWNMGTQATQFNTNLLLQLQAMRQGLVGNYSSGITAGVVSGLGAIGGALIGGPFGAAAGSQLGGIFGKGKSQNQNGQSQPGTNLLQ